MAVGHHEARGIGIARILGDLRPTSIVLDDYTRFLYHIAERSLPEAFVRVADALRRGDAEKMLEQKNTVFMLEMGTKWAHSRSRRRFRGV